MHILKIIPKIRKEFYLLKHIELIELVKDKAKNIS